MESMTLYRRTIASRAHGKGTLTEVTGEFEDGRVIHLSRPSAACNEASESGPRAHLNLLNNTHNWLFCVFTALPLLLPCRAPRNGRARLLSRAPGDTIVITLAVRRGDDDPVVSAESAASHRDRAESLEHILKQSPLAKRGARGERSRHCRLFNAHKRLPGQRGSGGA